MITAGSYSHSISDNWDCHYFHADDPALIAPGLTLSGVGLEFFRFPTFPRIQRIYRAIEAPECGIFSHGYIDSDPGDWFDGAEDFSLYYYGIAQAFKAGSRVRYDRMIEALSSGHHWFMGDVIRHYITNNTPDPISLPITFTNSTSLMEGPGRWLELGRFVDVGGEVIRETSFRVDIEEGTEYMFEGPLTVPPGAWDLNFCMSHSAIGGMYYHNGGSYCRLWVYGAEFEQPSPTPSRARRKRAAWMDLERPAIL